jgi:hypothetical protein
MPIIFRFVTFITAAVLALGLTRAASASETWTIVQAVGDVTVIGAPGVTPVAVKPSAPLPAGATVTTGPEGRAILLRGRETIVMSPSSQVTLPSGPDKSLSRVKQNSGTLLFKVGKKPEAHFEVNTPYLAAVVKGTTFTVKITSKGASVHVLEGAVEVATNDRSESFLTRAGQISSVFAKSAGSIFTTGATLLDNSASTESGWANGSAEFQLNSGPGFWDTLAPTYNDAGLRAHVQQNLPEGDLTERAPSKLLAAAKATDETLSAARKSHETVKPKNGMKQEAGLKEADKAAKQQQSKSAAAEEQAAKDGKRTNKAAKAAPGNTKTQSASSKAPVEKALAEEPVEIANRWTVTQVKGAVKVDGLVFEVTAQGLTRTLAPGAKVETGPDSRLGVAFGTKEFVIDANSIVVLADAVAQNEPLVVSGVAMQYVESTGKYEPVTPLTSSQVAELRASGGLDGTGSARGGSAGSIQSGPSDATGSEDASVPGPKVNRIGPSHNKKTEEVRTKVIGGLTLGLYGLTGALMVFFGARWAWGKYKAKKVALDVETPAQSRLRNIKGT